MTWIIAYQTGHDWWLFLAAAGVCLLGSYASVVTLQRARDSAGEFNRLAIAVLVGGFGIWASQFLLMWAAQPNAKYDVLQAVLSGLVSCGLVWASFAAAVRRCAIGPAGFLFGTSIVAAHYTGVMAWNAAGHLEWNFAYVATSAALGIGGAMLGFYISWRGHAVLHRVGTALALTAAGIGVHFADMLALKIVGEAVPGASPLALSPQWLAGSIAIVVVAITALGVFGAAVNRRLFLTAARERERLKAYIAELEATQQQLETTAANLEVALDAAAAGARAKSQFLSAMSHEFRTPLNAVIGFSEMLSDEVFGPIGDRRYKEYIRDIHTSGQDLLQVINDVLDLSNLDAGSLALVEEDVDLSALIQGALRMVRRSAEDGRVNLTEYLSPDLPVVRGDERRILQILLNLLSNAIAFTPEGGTVDVASFRRDGVLVIAVRDTGVGIAPENIGKLLDQFEQLDSSFSRKHQGMGVGLPLSKRLIELHGGTLRVESTPSVGTVVTLTLPADRLVEALYAA